MSEDKKKKLFEAKIITLGDGQVGKSSLIVRYVDNSFSTNYLSTIGVDSKYKKIQLNGEEIKVRIFDTAGQERFRSITSDYIRKANGMLLVYDISHKPSYDNIENWINSLKEETGQKMIPAVLIGNKKDLTDERVITEEQGRELAKRYEMEEHFYETSCSTGENVQKAFSDLIEQIYNKNSNKTSNSNIKIDIKNKNKKKKCC
jgi:small GTP-binding protein